MDDSNNHETMRKQDANKETLAQAEWQAFYRHFQNITIGRFKQAALIYVCMYVCVCVHGEKELHAQTVRGVIPY
jgi:hypothetical protein